MAHVVLCWEIGAGYGHLMPLRLLAQHFRAQGHRLSALVRDPQAARALLGPLGVDVRAAPLPAPPARDFPLSLTYSDNLRRNGYWHADALATSLDGWRRAFGELAPDLLLADHAPGALLASRGAVFPRAALGMGFTLPPRVAPMPGLQPWFPVPAALLAAREAEFLGDVNPALEGLGLAPLAEVCGIFDGVERFLCAFPEFDHHDGREGERWWGPLLSAAPLPAPAWPAGGKKVFVYMSAANRFLPAVLASLAARGAAVLAYLRDPAGPVAGPLTAPGIRYLDGLVDLERVAHDCDAAITQGGFGSMAAFLTHGRPLLICPLELEQALLGWRLRQRGLADALTLFSPLADVAQRVDTLLAGPAPTLRQRDFARRQAAHDAGAAAAAIVARCTALLHPAPT